MSTFYMVILGIACTLSLASFISEISSLELLVKLYIDVEELKVKIAELEEQNGNK